MIIKVDARTQIHGFSSPTMSFQIPPQEDYTLAGSTQSWNPDGSELRDKEFGILNSQNVLQFRNGNTINTIAFQTGGATGGLQSVLATDNTTGAYSIVMGTTSRLNSYNGNYLDLDVSGDIYLARLNGGNLYISDYAQLNSASSSVDLSAGTNISLSATHNITTLAGTNSKMLTTGGNGIMILDNTLATQSSVDVNANSIFIGTRNSSMANGATNSVIIGGYGLVGTQSNTVYMQNLFVQGDFATGTPAISTKSDGTTQIYNVTFATGSGITLANVLQVGSDPAETPISGTFTLASTQGPDTFIISAPMKPGGTESQGLFSSISHKVRQRAFTSTQSADCILVDSIPYDGNGITSVTARIFGRNNDWGDNYYCELSAAIGTSGLLPGLTGGPEITKNEKFMWASQTFSATASMVYSNGFGSMDLVVYAGVPGQINWMIYYEVDGFGFPV